MANAIACVVGKHMGFESERKAAMPFACIHFDKKYGAAVLSQLAMGSRTAGAEEILECEIGHVDVVVCSFVRWLFVAMPQQTRCVIERARAQVPFLEHCVFQERGRSCCF